MDEQTQVEPVRIETSLTLEGDWQAEPLRVIAGIREGTRTLDKFLRKAVRLAREQGVSWEEIGAAYGISRQAAWERFSKD